MFKEKEQQLKERLKNIISEIGHNSDIKQAIVDEFKSRNLSALRASWVFSENLDIITLTDSDEDIKFLFLFTFALSKSLEGNSEIKINVEDYFTNVEIDKWKNYREEKLEDTVYPIVIKNVDIIADGHWQTVMSAQEIERLNAANLLIYNPNTQRQMKVTKAGIKINVNSKKVNAIAERMLNGEQFPDNIKINILKNDEDSIDYNQKTRTLTIHEGSQLNTFDGQHRKSGNALALTKNPDLQFNWAVTITNFSETKAHDFMTQINKQTPIAEEFLQTKDYSKNENRVVEAIMDSKGDLSKVVKETDDYIRTNRGLTTKSILAQAIADKYSDQIEISVNVRKVANWIVEFTDQLMGLYVDEFIAYPYKVKEISYINNKNLFYGYIALSAKLYNNDNWKELLKQKMESLDFNITNPQWRDIGIIGDRDTNKSTRNKIYSLFEEDLS